MMTHKKKYNKFDNDIITIIKFCYSINNLEHNVKEIGYVIATL